MNTTELYKINVQGQPQVNNATIIYETDEAVCIELEMSERDCEVLHQLGVGGRNLPGLMVGKVKEMDVPTSIYFPQYEGYNLFAYVFRSQRTLSVCLLRFNKQI